MILFDGNLPKSGEEFMWLRESHSISHTYLLVAPHVVMWVTHDTTAGSVYAAEYSLIINIDCPLWTSFEGVRITLPRRLYSLASKQCLIRDTHDMTRAQPLVDYARGLSKKSLRIFWRKGTCAPWSDVRRFSARQLPYDSTSR